MNENPQARRNAAEWDMLLDRRPPQGDSDEMAAWIKRVFAVSNAYSASPPMPPKASQDMPFESGDLSNIIETVVQQHLASRISSGDNATSSSDEHSDGNSKKRKRRR